MFPHRDLVSRWTCMLWLSLVSWAVASGQGTEAEGPQAARYGPKGPTSWTGIPEVVSWSPRAVVYDNFLTEAECDHLLSLAEPLMEPAMLVSATKRNKHVRSPKRTSYGAFFDRGEDEIIANIDKRIAYVTKFPAENAEPLQVMQYSEDGLYTPHVDYYTGEERYFGHSIERFGGQRIATALLYLTTPEGGETVFHRARKSNDIGRDSCAERGSGVESIRGRMVVFNNIQPDGHVDHASSHQSCAVTGGRKIVISRFIREQACPLNKFFSKRKWNGNVACEDDHLKCAEWESFGHCESEDPDVKYRMVGDSVDPGFCEKTCNQCRDLEPDVEKMLVELAKERKAKNKGKKGRTIIH